MIHQKMKKITTEVLKDITTHCNHSINELIDNCLIQNRNKTIKILIENNFNNDDAILIIRTFLSKCKRILELSNEFNKNNNVDLTVSSAKPPIFWKDKETIKQQILLWKPNQMKNNIFASYELELIIKRNLDNSLNLTFYFKSNNY